MIKEEQSYVHNFHHRIQFATYFQFHEEEDVLVLAGPCCLVLAGRGNSLIGRVRVSDVLLTDWKKKEKWSLLF